MNTATETQLQQARLLYTLKRIMWRKAVREVINKHQRAFDLLAAYDHGKWKPVKFIVEVDNSILGGTNAEFQSLRISSAVRFIADRLALYENNIPDFQLLAPVEFLFEAVDGDTRTTLGTLRLRQE